MQTCYHCLDWVCSLDLCDPLLPVVDIINFLLCLQLRISKWPHLRGWKNNPIIIYLFGLVGMIEQIDMAYDCEGVHMENNGLDETASLFAVASVFNYRKEMSIKFLGVFRDATEAKALAYRLCCESRRYRNDDDDSAQFDSWLYGTGLVYYRGNGFDRDVYWVYSLPAID
jgi:hypothetical protein